MLEFLGGLITATVGIALAGTIATWILRQASRSREPAFAAFCLTLGLGMARSPTIDPGGQWEAPLGHVIGTVLVLVLQWRLLVRRERRRLDGEEDQQGA